MESDYQPIDCGFYDRLEVWAMKKEVCRVEFLGDDGALNEANDRIANVFSENKQEFMELGDGQRIRLDRLVRVNGMDVGDSCQITPSPPRDESPHPGR